MTAETTSVEPELLADVVIRFAGDSGDGMQIAGDRFTDASAIFGNDLATLPNFPAEIRAPAGTIAGVSSFQVHISDHDIVTPGDSPNVLVAMNPAALKANLAEMPPGSTLLVNSDAFDERNLGKVGYEVKTKKRVKYFEPTYKLNYDTFDTLIDADGRAMIDEDFTETVCRFKEWCKGQEKTLQDLFIKDK